MEQLGKRKSNIELLRIISMLMIVAHHYVVNSGIMDTFSLGSASSKYIFLSFLGMWGKTGINIFILISGYFMCTSRLTIKRYCKVFFEWLFYNWIVFFIMFALGYETLNMSRIFNLLFGIFRYANGSGCFESSFFIFYLFIPFINTFIKNTSKQEYKTLIIYLTFVFSILSTFFFNKVIFGEVFWFIAIYLMAGYLRLYPPKWSTNLKASRNLLIISLILSYASILFIVYVRSVLKKDIGPFYFVSDANKLGALLVGVFMFTTFNNFNIKHSRTINLIASTTFGVLLIHANSDAVRQFLWKDLLHVNTSSSLPLALLIVRSIFIIIVVFITCSLIDIARIKLIEKPLFNNFNKIENIITNLFARFKKICTKLYTAAIKAVS